MAARSEATDRVDLPSMYSAMVSMARVLGRGIALALRCRGLDSTGGLNVMGAACRGRANR